MPRLSTRTVLLAMLGFAVTVPIALLAIVFVTRWHRLPDLKVSALDEAERRWQQAALDDYRLHIEIGGRRAGQVEIVVRGGAVVHMTRDGVTPKRVETWQAWTVPGMFETLRLECESASQPQKSFGVSQPTQVILRGEFDPANGLPRKYQRIVLGADNEMSWTVTRFEPDAAGS